MACCPWSDRWRSSAHPQQTPCPRFRSPAMSPGVPAPSAPGASRCPAPRSRPPYRGTGRSASGLRSLRCGRCCHAGCTSPTRGRRTVPPAGLCARRSAPTPAGLARSAPMCSDQSFRVAPSVPWHPTLPWPQRTAGRSPASAHIVPVAVHPRVFPPPSCCQSRSPFSDSSKQGSPRWQSLPGSGRRAAPRG